MNTIKIFNKMFLNLLDNLQLEIDKKNSQVKRILFIK